MNRIKWIGKTDTPKSEWGINGENCTKKLKAEASRINVEQRSILFRKEINAPKEILKATASVCGLGYYDFFINGKKVGDFVLAPIETNYLKRVLYDEFDVTEMLKNGKNTIGVELGNGRYSIQKRYWSWRAAWYGDPCLALKLAVTYTDGSQETFSTDKTWKTSYGAVTFNCFYDGEHYDANLEQKAWNENSFDDSDWDNALEVVAPKGELEKNKYFHIKKTHSIKPVKINEKLFGKYVYDFGENISGWVKITVKGKKGERIRIRYAEKLVNGTLDSLSNGNAENTDYYTLNDENVQKYEPRFTLHGFSAIEITIANCNAEIIDVEAYHVRADLERTGKFSCDNEDVNRLHDIILRTQKSALMCYPIDCPQRDERLGWLGDAHLTDLTCMYNFDMYKFYDKWLKDIRLSQHSETGAISHIAPWHSFFHAVDWSAGYAIILWDWYLFYRDKNILTEHVDALIKYVEFLGEEGPILEKSKYGDWMSVVEGWNRGDPACCTTLYYYYCLTILIEILKVLGKDELKLRFEEIKENVRAAILDKFYNTETKVFDDNTQFSLSFALKLRLIPTEDTEDVVNNLTQDIKNHDYHLTTGILGTKYVMEVLRDNNKQDVAMKLILQNTYPSWLNLIENKTTLSERWDGTKSQNHCMFGSVDGIFYSMLAGIKVDEEITISPYFADEINEVNAEVELANGSIGVSWERTENEIDLTITIKGDIEVKYNSEVLTSGIHYFKI